MRSTVLHFYHQVGIYYSIIVKYIIIKIVNTV